VWRRLIAAESGITAIQSFDVADLPAKIAGQVPLGTRAEGGLDLAEWIPPKDHRKMDRFIHLALVAAIEAVEDSGWLPQDDEGQERTGVMIGSGIGGLQTIYDASVLVREGKARRLSPFFIPSALINLASGHLSIKYSFKGPNHSAVTACATGVHAIGDAARLIMLGDAEVMVAGGSEAAVCPLGIAGFSASRALSTNFNDEPARASRPWDRDRDGFVMGEGAGVVVLEEYEHARRRAAKIYAEVVGYGMSGDAHHITAPAEAASPRTRSATSTPTAPPRRRPTISNSVPSSGCSAMRRAGSRCRRQNRRSATCWGQPGRSKEYSRSWRSATAWCRRRSTSTTRAARR
jgi:3-oxoacyl-[acyl-carrier-protein] synthase II